MTFFTLEIENKIYKIDLFPEVRVAVTRHMMGLYVDYCAVNPDKQITFEEYLNLVETQPHPENQQLITDITEDCFDDPDIKRKDYLIDSLLGIISKIK